MHWRYSANQATIGPVDASVLIPFLAILIWPAKAHWTFDVIWYGSLASVVILWIAGRRGYTPGAALRLLRAKIGEWIGRGSRPIYHAYLERKVRRSQ